MPHVNHFRGETGRFVFRREHAFYTCSKGWSHDKRRSNKDWKQEGNRRLRAITRERIAHTSVRDDWDSWAHPIKGDASDRWDLW